ncbi:hypothetical protein [Caminibacter pacificus]|uniref:Uncharacterized protein n=1 Tax=Caminibacter pacificus TaxID=1424653 RepID=A0AAJ4RDC3_9BACT|nr:hypothetical protein [Caminibacter pacificus]QCI28679.1 hypothetical protein C6V80_06770 [Caminibacter pacificus]ROR40590.1 hypothetical protein EDC58_0069 [Caminibacter pacificus]
MIKKSLSIMILSCAVFASGKIVFENSSKSVIECDDNKTVVILNKKSDEFVTKDGEIFQSVQQAIKEKCN